MKNLMKVIIVAMSILLMSSISFADTTTTANADAAAGINDNRFIDESFNSTSRRGFAVPGDVMFPGTPGYFGKATPGHRFIPLAKLLMYKSNWSVDEANNMLSSKRLGKDVQIRDLIDLDDAMETANVICTTKIQDGVVKQLSIGTVAATNGKSISADVFAKIIAEAGKRGATHIQFLAEGVNREIDVHGFGFGINNSVSMVGGGSDDDVANVATGGIGYSRGWGGYKDLPWLQFTYLLVN